MYEKLELDLDFVKLLFLVTVAYRDCGLWFLVVGYIGVGTDSNPSVWNVHIFVN